MCWRGRLVKRASFRLVAWWSHVYYAIKFYGKFGKGRGLFMTPSPHAIEENTSGGYTRKLLHKWGFDDLDFWWIKTCINVLPVVNGLELLLIRSCCVNNSDTEKNRCFSKNAGDGKDKHVCTRIKIIVPFSSTTCNSVCLLGYQWWILLTTRLV